MKNYNDEIFYDRLKNFLFGAVEYLKNEPESYIIPRDCADYEITADSFSFELGELIADMFCASVTADDNGLLVSFTNGKSFRLTVTPTV